MVKGIHIVHEGSEANSWKALNRHRFASDAEQLAVWLSATNILGPVHPQRDRPRRAVPRPESR